MILESVITCPTCGARRAGQMPTDACRYFYDCTSCGERFKPGRSSIHGTIWVPSHYQSQR